MTSAVPNIQVTQALLCKAHSKLITQGQTQTESTLLLVEVLGGIDVILQTFLKSKDILMHENTLHQIDQILKTPKHCNRNGKQTLLYTQDISKEVNDGQMYGVYRFKKSNNYLNDICSIKNAERLRQIVMSRKMVVFILLAFAIRLWLRLQLGNESAVFLIYDIICMAISIPFYASMALFCNKKAIKLVISSFDFWIKVCSAIIVVTVWNIYNYHNNAPLLRKIGMILVSLWGVLFLMICASFDAIPYLKGWMKSFLSMSIALFLLFWVVYYEFMVPRDKDYVIVINDKGSYISFHSMLAGWFKVIGIFLVKQAINTFLSKGKCISIRYIPFIEWIDEELHTKTNTIIQMYENENDYEVQDNEKITEEIEIKQIHQRDDTDNFESVECSKTNSDDIEESFTLC
eukprot:158992_1